MLNKQNLERLIKEEVAHPYQESLIGLIRPAIRLRTVPVSEADIPVGSSKIGGLPDFPDALTWPQSEYDGQPMWFLGQINLSEVSSFDVEGLLPREGVLYFFARYDDGKVLYANNTNQTFQRAPAPQEVKRSFWKRLWGKKLERTHFESCQLKISTDYTFPSYDSYYLDRLQVELKTNEKPVDAFGEYFWEKYEQITLEKETVSRHQLLGYAKGIQDEYLEGNTVPSLIESKNPQKSDYDQLLRWILLFQVDSDDNSKMCWADWGRIYFLIEKEHLAKADFSQVFTTIQCY